MALPFGMGGGHVYRQPDCNSIQIDSQNQDCMKQQEDCIEIDDDSDPQPFAEAQPINIKGGTSFDVQYAICSEDAQQNEGKVINSRLKRFFEYGVKLQPGKEYQRPKKEPNYIRENVQPLDNQLILFGVDFSKQKLIRKQYKPTSIKVIDFSNWKLTYDNYAEAWTAIQQNIKDPQLIVNKIESDEVIVPRCWFEMKPAVFKNIPVPIWARFATSDELNIEMSKEEELNVYKLSREIFNEKERQKQDELNQMEYIGREKLERRKERASQNLHNQFERQSGRNWHPGLNENPGAHRDSERERSRDNTKRNKPGEMRAEQDEDVKSNYSFLMSRSKQDAVELNAALNDLNIENKSSMSHKDAIELNLSYNLDFEFINESPAQAQPNSQLNSQSNPQPHSQPHQSPPNYLWGEAIDEARPLGYRWSYRDYMVRQEREQEQLRQKQKILVQVISLDDD